MTFYGEARKLTTGGVFPRTPSQHAEMLHPLKANGQVFIGRKLPPNHKFRQDANPYQPWELDAVLHGVAGEPDMFLTQNRFYGARKAEEEFICELSAMWSDIDYYKVPELAGLAPESVLEMALKRLQIAGIPEPSLALFSGQGLYLTFLHYPVGSDELPRWSDCQRALWKVLKPLGADHVSLDAPRLLRLVGTRNSKSGELYAGLGSNARTSLSCASVEVRSGSAECRMSLFKAAG